MTELIVNGVRAVLSSDFAVTVKQENPFVTKNGEYTYDCTMSLLNPINANLYSFLQRINKREAFATNRRVILIADNRVYCDGTEVITKWTDTKVTIQIVSGNSQFNYFIGSDKKISELNLGKADTSTSNVMYSIFNSQKLGYCFPVITIGDEVCNSYKITDKDWFYDKGAYLKSIVLSATDDAKWIAMPFLYVMVEKIITALGYTITKDVISSTKYANMILLHGVDTDEFAKMIPGWTCKEFLEEIEKLFNIYFVINYKTKEVEITTSTAYYSTAGMVHVINTKDAYESEIDKDNDNNSYTTGNIGYGFPNSEYYNLRRIPNDIIKLAEIVTVNNESDVNAVTSGDMKLVKVKGNTDYWMYYTKNNGLVYLNGHTGEAKEWQRCNEYKDIIQDDTKEDLDIEIGLIPVEMVTTSIPCDISHSINGLNISLSGYPSLMATINSVASEEKKSSIYEYITGGISSESKSSLYVGFYDAPINLDQNYTIDKDYGSNSYIKIMLGTAPFQMGFLLICINNLSYPSVSVFPGYDPFTGLGSEKVDESFRLDRIASIFYQKSYNIMYKQKLTIESYDPNIYDTRQIFEIKNKRYICESIEYALDSKGRKGTWKGIFYPVDISDTDAEHLWILSDGRWRDNGVWLDNGRWLDN